MKPNSIIQDNFDADEAEIIALIKRESQAFYERDFIAWANCWHQHEDLNRFGSCVGGMDVQMGWDATSKMIKEMMAQVPIPNPRAAENVRRENIRIRKSIDMAWMSFDQFSGPDDDIFVTMGLSHQLRILEKHDGAWKIVHVGSYDALLEYINRPIIRLDENGTIIWINDAARSSLINHPVLVERNGTIRTKKTSDQLILLKTLKRAAAMTIIDMRAAVQSDLDNHAAIPLVIDEEFTDVPHILWISLQDGMLLLSFDDLDTQEKQLNIAMKIYNLSTAQRRMASEITKGHDLVKASQNLNISASTARTHLQRMFDKTGVRSQTALVRVLMTASAHHG